ncbi:MULTISPECIES: uroporphyrinogen-III synthase [Francisella]|uniref:Uroporphyrinogen-III synthase n=1 Tax=Francisella opportunistica TaxID=2016517 RepID=A0A345JQ65_9GAMM|nr:MULTISPECIES: uroporphyrinogen-III synthase [Francisella]APC91155.1 Uroporphyrinogen-III synthase [Francisella sp. MA067296]AXH29461.1 uroporphyrinogen-III synthase [Francisella opportunistica]AXH31112.1 uroporphyrinogen-III synthase [Francisella opportunistica]AXH32757.1 uroporphyrinogen-III synthase [Francisella opportunistica]
MKILVCRPQDDADSLTEQLCLNGLLAISLPTIKICYQKIAKNVVEYTSLVFTSKYAVKSLFSQYDADLFKNKKIYSVGASTAAVLKKYQLDAIYPVRHGSQELLNIILNYDISTDKFAIISGVSGNNLLVEELSKLTQCHKFETYSRVFMEIDELTNEYNKLFLHQQPGIIIATSLDVFKSLNRVFEKITVPKAATVTITSPKMLKFVNQQGFKNTLKLEKLDNNYICQRILEFTEAKDVSRKKHPATK